MVDLHFYNRCGLVVGEYVHFLWNATYQGFLNDNFKLNRLRCKGKSKNWFIMETFLHLNKELQNWVGKKKANGKPNSYRHDGRICLIILMIMSHSHVITTNHLTWPKFPREAKRQWLKWMRCRPNSKHNDLWRREAEVKKGKLITKLIRKEGKVNRQKLPLTTDPVLMCTTCHWWGQSALAVASSRVDVLSQWPSCCGAATGQCC